MEETVELRFKYTEDEYVLAYRQYLLAQKRSTFAIGIALALIIVGIYLLLSGGIDARVKWGIYKKAVETKKFYLLSDGASTLTVIPKRAFTSAAQESVFRNLLDIKV